MKKKTISMLIILALILSISATAFAASPKYKSTKAFIEVLKEYDIEYTLQTGEFNDEIINFVDGGNYRDTIDIDASFWDTEDEMTLYSFSLVEFQPRDRAKVLDAVNELNSSFSYGTFFVVENFVNVSWDVILGEKDIRNIAEEALVAFFHTVDEGYNELAKFEK